MDAREQGRATETGIEALYHGVGHAGTTQVSLVGR
jgi:hypothetical protein